MGFWGYKCLTMTYFNRRMSTIIGAKAFQGPVRDGKAWDHLAMFVKRNLLRCRASEDARHCQLGSEAQGEGHRQARSTRRSLASGERFTVIVCWGVVFALI